jgi:WD40 domain-containing protein
VHTVVFSPDGSTLASCDSWNPDGRVRLWDTDTGAPHREFPVPVGVAGSSVAFSLDGSTLATCGDGNVRLWDTDTGAPHGEFPAGAWSVVFSPDGSTLASCDSDGYVRLWDTGTGALHREFPGHIAEVSLVVFSPNGFTLASGCYNGKARLWDTGTGTLRCDLAAHTGGVFSLAFSPDGSTLASGGKDGTVRLWDTGTGKLRCDLAARTDAVWSVVFSPDGSTLASGGEDGTVRLWDTGTGRLRGEFPVPASAEVVSMVSSADGSTLAPGSDGTVQLPDAPTGKRSAPPTGHMPADVRRPGAPRTAYVLALVLAGGLIVLRAFDQDFSFLGVGWILVFALVPLLPWLLPLVVPWFRRMAPYIQDVRIGSLLELQLRETKPRVEGLAQVSSILSMQPLDTTGTGQFSSTDAGTIIDSMNELHDVRAELVIIGLEGGAKWRYPNLYFLARLLEADPGVRQMIFTEARGGGGGFFLCMGSPSELRERLEAAVPAYARAGRLLNIPCDMTAPGLHDVLKQQFDDFRQALTAMRGQFPEVEEWVRSAELVKLLGTVGNRISIEAKDPLTEDDYRTIFLSPFRYVATVADGRFCSVIDQVPLATAFARIVLSLQK